MGRAKGGTNRKWSKEEKVRIVKRYLNERMSQKSLALEENISRGMLSNWIKTYLENGESGLENKKKTGNLYAALHTSKSLTEVERLNLTILKQEIEIARLKKGYLVEGDGANKVFVSIKDANTKSSKK